MTWRSTALIEGYGTVNDTWCIFYCLQQNVSNFYGLQWQLIVVQFEEMKIVDEQRCVLYICRIHQQPGNRPSLPFSPNLLHKSMCIGPTSFPQESKQKQKQNKNREE